MRREILLPGDGGRGARVKCGVVMIWKDASMQVGGGTPAMGGGTGEGGKLNYLSWASNRGQNPFMTSEEIVVTSDQSRFLHAYTKKH